MYLKYKLNYENRNIKSSLLLIKSSFIIPLLKQAPYDLYSGLPTDLLDAFNKKMWASDLSNYGETSVHRKNGRLEPRMAMCHSN
jgi:hypothetical protein